MSSQYEDAVYNSSNNMMSVLVPFECGHKGDGTIQLCSVLALHSVQTNEVCMYCSWIYFYL